MNTLTFKKEPNLQKHTAVGYSLLVKTRTGQCNVTSVKGGTKRGQQTAFNPRVGLHKPTHSAGGLLL